MVLYGFIWFYIWFNMVLYDVFFLAESGEEWDQNGIVIVY
jgi:hypothetical protein